jgi:hypothetical protein
MPLRMLQVMPTVPENSLREQNGRFQLPGCEQRTDCFCMLTFRRATSNDERDAFTCAPE